MKVLEQQTILHIDHELKSIPEKYQKDFNSIHEGYAVILEEVRELENEVFFGEKIAKGDALGKGLSGDELSIQAKELHKKRMREECIQIAAMCSRFIQELT